MCLLSRSVEKAVSLFFILCFTVRLRLYFRQTRNRMYDHAHNTTFHSGTRNAEGNLRSHQYNVRRETAISYPKDFQSQVPYRALRRTRALALFASVRQNRSHLLRKKLHSRHLNKHSYMVSPCYKLKNFIVYGTPKVFQLLLRKGAFLQISVVHSWLIYRSSRKGHRFHLA